MRAKNANVHLLQVSHQPCLSANEKDDNEMMSVAVHRSPSIYLTADENPGKPQLGDRLMKALWDQSLPQMGSLSSK